MFRGVTSPDRCDCIVLGGGLHAKVVIDALLAMGLTPRGVLDPDRGRWGTQLLGVPILGGDELLQDLARLAASHFTVGIGSIGDASLRSQLFVAARQHGLKPCSVRHPTSIVAPSAVCGEGVQLLAGSIVNPCAEIGPNAIVNTGAIIEHDCRIGAHAHVSPGARMGGSVVVGEGAHIGLGATVLQNLHVGARSIVGAGAVVVDHVPDDVTVIGVPARIYRRRAA